MKIAVLLFSGRKVLGRGRERAWTSRGTGSACSWHIYWKRFETSTNVEARPPTNLRSTAATCEHAVPGGRACELTWQLVHRIPSHPKQQQQQLSQIADSRVSTGLPELGCLSTHPLHAGGCVVAMGTCIHGSDLGAPQQPIAARCPPEQSFEPVRSY